MPKKHNDMLYESVDSAKILLRDAIELYCNGNYKQAVASLSLAHKIFLAHKDISKVSVCLSLTALVKYINKDESYYKSLLLLEDSKFLAESSNDKDVFAVNKFAFGEIYFHENKFNEAVFYLAYAAVALDEYPLIRVRAFELLALTYIRLQNAKLAYEYLEKAINLSKELGLVALTDRLVEISENFINTNSTLNSSYKQQLKKKQDPDKGTTLLLALSKIARTVNAEANLDKLLMTIAEQTKLVLNADRCTVFLLDKEKNELWSKVALGMESEEIRFSSDKGFAGHVVNTGETIIIQDAYKDSRFNKEIDKHTGYRTYNLICMPIRNIKFEIIGVFQVLNKKDGDFTEADEEILLAIGTNAGIAIENNLLFNIQQQMIDEQQKLFAGFIDTLAASIDARDKITLGHSKRVRLYSELICNQLKLNQDITQIIARAAMLHDIGKIGIRDAVLQKKGSLTKEEYEHIKEHVKITYDILRQTNMSTSFMEIAEIAASHHEKYDGTGYFRGLKGEEIPFGGRILAVSDVFDAITYVRHYRDRMPMNNVLDIMLEGKNKHFDGKIVDAFLSIPCDILMEVLLSEFEMHLKDKDRKLLATITLDDFARILKKEEPTAKETKLVETFNSYYIRKEPIV